MFTINLLLRSLFVLSFLFAHLIFSPSGAGANQTPPNCFYNFESALRHPQEILDTHGTAVLWLSVESTDFSGSGTGYIIDADNGYVFTAAHVVRGKGSVDPKGSDITIIGFNQHIEEEHIELEYVADLSEGSNVDLALLKIKDLTSSSLRDLVRPIDISLATPKQGDNFTILGYPRGEDTLDFRNGTFNKLASTDQSGTAPRIEVGHEVWEGHSGSPLINSKGHAVALATDRIGADRGIYLPLANSLPLFNTMFHPEFYMRKRLLKLDEKIQDSSIDEATIANYLRSSAISNFDLIIWAIYFSDNIEKYESNLEFFDCPFQRAYFDRDIAGAFWYISEAVRELRMRSFTRDISPKSRDFGTGRLTDWPLD